MDVPLEGDQMELILPNLLVMRNGYIGGKIRIELKFTGRCF